MYDVRIEYVHMYTGHILNDTSDSLRRIYRFER